MTNPQEIGNLQFCDMISDTGDYSAIYALTNILLLLTLLLSHGQIPFAGGRHFQLTPFPAISERRVGESFTKKAVNKRSVGKMLSLENKLFFNCKNTQRSTGL